MNKPESVRENEANKNLWKFDLQTDHKTPTWKTNLKSSRKKKDLDIN